MLKMMKIRSLPLDYEQILYQQNQKNMEKNQTVAYLTEKIEKRQQNHMGKTFQ